jgi:hypothetical protein
LIRDGITRGILGWKLRIFKWKGVRDFLLLIRTGVMIWIKKGKGILIWKVGIFIWKYVKRWGGIMRWRNA